MNAGFVLLSGRSRARLLRQDPVQLFKFKITNFTIGSRHGILHVFDDAHQIGVGRTAVQRQICHSSARIVRNGTR